MLCNILYKHASRCFTAERKFFGINYYAIFDVNKAVESSLLDRAKETKGSRISSTISVSLSLSNHTFSLCKPKKIL